MPTRQQVLNSYRALADYAAVGDQLGLPAGQAYLIATGIPADGSDTPGPPGPERPGGVDGSTQHLVYPRSVDNAESSSEVHRWIKRMAAGDAQMQAAAKSRDAAPGEVEEPDDTDIVTVLTRQHDQVTALIKQLKAIPGVSKGGSPVHQSRRASIVDMITVALSKHEATEQELFWPWIRDLLDDGDDVAAEAFEQEQEGKEVLTEIGRSDPSDEHFDELAEKLESAARRHVAFEDRVLLRVTATSTGEERAAIGGRFLGAEDHAPTRPHRHAPEHPAAAVKVAGAAGATLDRVRDKVGDRPAKRRGRAESDPDATGGPEQT